MGQRHKRKRGRLSGTGEPDPSKDRAQHEAARGLKMKTLADLSRELPNEEEISQLFSLMENESDSGSALVAGSFVEAAVYMAIAAKLVEDRAITDAIFHGANAPVATFSAKIRLGLGLGMYGPVTAERLGTIKDIRNAFAHALRPLDFNHPTIVAACDSLTPNPLPKAKGTLAPARVRYLAVCRILFKQIFDKALEEGGKPIEYNLP